MFKKNQGLVRPPKRLRRKTAVVYEVDPEWGMPLDSEDDDEDEDDEGPDKDVRDAAAGGKGPEGGSGCGGTAMLA